MMTDVLAYVRGAMSGLPGGYKEWLSGFNSENIPRSVIDKSYFVKFGAARTKQTDQRSSQLEMPFVVQVYRGGQRDSLANRDAGISSFDAVLKAMIKIIPATNSAGVLNVTFQGGAPRQFDKSNEHAVLVEMSFTALTAVPRE
jgi:hypothetical protein